MTSAWGRGWVGDRTPRRLLFCGAAGAADTIADLAIDFRMNPLDGQVAPAFTLSALDGKRLSLADFKGQVVLLYFWASW